MPAATPAGITTELLTPGTTAPKLTGEAKLPLAEESWAVKTLPSGKAHDPTGKLKLTVTACPRQTGVLATPGVRLRLGPSTRKGALADEGVAGLPLRMRTR